MKSGLSHPHATSLSPRQWREGERAWSRWGRGGRDLLGILRSAASGWMAHGAMEQAAAIAYYAAFSLAPIVVIVVAIAGMVFGADRVREEVVAQFDAMMGRQGGELVGAALESANQPRSGLIATLISIGALLLGATGTWGQLKEALNRTWEVRSAPNAASMLGGVWTFVRTRFISFAMVLVIAFLLLTSLTISAVLAGVGKWTEGALPGWATLLQITNFVVSLGIVTVLFALIFRFLPEAHIGWREVWIGAVITALLFTIGKFLIGLYIGRSSPASVYGAAGSLAIILVWVYYSALIFLFGAEITRAHADRLGRMAIPKPGAERRDTTGPGSSRRGGGESPPARLS